MHEECCIIRECFGFGFVEGIDNPGYVLAASDFNEEYFDHDYEEVGAYDITLGDSLFEWNLVSEVSSYKYLRGSVVQE